MKSKYEVAWFYWKKYVLEVAIVHVDHSVGLEPCTDVSELAFNDAHWPEEWVIEIDLIDWVSPSVTNADTFKFDASCLLPGFVDYDFSGEGWYVMTAEWLASDIKWGFLEGWPGFVEIIKEVEQMVGSLMSARDLVWALTVSTVEWKTDVQWLVDE